jgi:hypothetical protein
LDIVFLVDTYASSLDIISSKFGHRFAVAREIKDGKIRELPNHLVNK